MFKLIVKIIICLTLIIFLAGQSYVSHAQEVLSLGVHPYRPSTKLMKMFSPLADYLAVKTGKPVKIRIARDYQDHIDKAGNDKLDIAYFGPAPYVNLVNSYGKKHLLARLEIKGKPTFQGIIAVRKDSPIKDLTDLKGKKFAFGSAHSTMSHLVPRVTLWKAGVKVEDFAGHSFLGNHTNVALGVLSGEFDAGALKEETFHKYQDRGLRALAFTENISEHLFLVGSHVSPEMRDTVKKALLDLKNDPDGRQIMQAIKSTMTGMVPVKDSDYENLREIEKTLKSMGVDF